SKVFAFGWNKNGQLGLGHNEDQSLPVKLDFPAAGRVGTAIACLFLSSVALLDSGEVLAWGKNEDGILGKSADVKEQNIPRKVPGLEGITIKRIICGQNHALALSSDGKVYSWGWNEFRQLGNGTKESSHQPTLISGNCGRIRDVAAHFKSCVCAAVTETDEVYIWGIFYDQEILSPELTSITSLDEVFAKIPYQAMTFRALRPKLDETIEEKNTETKLPEWLKKSFNRADTADVVFVVEGKKIHAHKAILIMQCALFETMFLGDWKESHEREQIIKHHSYDAFFAFLKYFYTNEVDLQPDLALELFALAHFYHMIDLQKECLKIIKRGVTVENAASIYDKAIQLAAEELEEFVFNFCMEHMTAVVNSDGFRLLKDDVMREFSLRAAQHGVCKKKECCGASRRSESSGAAEADKAAAWRELEVGGRRSRAAGKAASMRPTSGGSRSEYIVYMPPDQLLHLTTTSHCAESSSISTSSAEVNFDLVRRQLAAAMSESLDKWKIFRELSDDLKQNIRLAVVFRGSAIYVTKDDEVFGFGKNEEGFLGTGDMKSRTEHTKIEQLCGQNIQGLNFSNHSFFALSASGSVFAWGRNNHGQLGLGTKENTLIPTKIEGISATNRVVQLACSSNHTLVLTSDREVFTFGWNKNGQLGLGHNEDQTLPVFAWGKNDYGILGQNADVKEQNIPCQVPGLEGIAITRIVCGQIHALALSSDGNVYSWGWNAHGQLGNGTKENSHQPTLITGDFGRIKDVAAHITLHLSAAVTEADEVYDSADVVFVVEGKKIHAHKSILIMRCIVFRTMFLGNWIESNQREQIIEHRSYDAFFAFLKYFYTNEVDPKPDLTLGQDIMSPKKTAFTSLDEVFANNQNRALTFRALRPKVTEPIEEKNTETELPEWLKNSFDDADTADVVFVVEGKKVHAHKAILIMRCVFFRTMFQGDWIESNQSYDAFFAFLKYFYTNEVDPQPDLALELFSLAHFYHMTDLQKECVKIIKRGVSVENAAVIYEKAIQLASEEIKEFVFNFCVENLNAVLNSDGFKLLQSEVVKEFVLRAAQQGVFKNI
ncbi:RCC1 and BTB domain-containing protein 2-like, partial [Cloeon dipterum]|uniref:RCC1 and BTB domain-containing protein 2-like n=1 Tax=Cloeon dipterum TaxID=197152 RepID=UPI00321F938E